MSDTNFWKRAPTGAISRRHLIRGASMAGAGLAGAALIGCGAKKTEPSPAASSPGAPAAATAKTAAAVQPKSGGRLQQAQAGDPPTFDLHTSSTNLIARPAEPLFSTLVQYDPAKPAEKPGDIIPDLAESWEVSKDGLTYVFKLKQGVKFHDGTPFVAADVKASYERQANPPKGLIPPRQIQFEVIKAMEMPDATTLKMTMGRPASPLSMLPIFAQGMNAIYSQKDAVNDKFDWKNKANGTGPYRDVRYERGVKVTMERNKDYHVKGRPYLDGLDIYLMPQAASRDAALLAGQLDLTDSLSAGSREQIKANLGEKAVYSRQIGLGFNVLNYNTSKAPWNDERVRQALNLGINKQDAIKVAAKGEGALGGYLVPDGDWALPQAEIEKLPGYQPQGPNSVAEAKKMLAAAGVKDGLEVNVLVRTSFYEDLCLFTGDQLAKLGFKAKQDPVETVVAYDRINKRNFDLVPWGFGSQLDDPDAIWQEFYLKASSRNYSELSTPEIEAAFLKQTVELDPVKRKALVADLQKVSLPVLAKSVYYWGTGESAVYKKVQGYSTHRTMYNNTKMQDVWLNA
ncbi:MAG: ABC transporter substrate-binding protein [Dehalococcoidia bacterium]|nr:MAG: ABC transporter substrate-binding protein [Dehalococcoidia bacterium]